MKLKYLTIVSGLLFAALLTSCSLLDFLHDDDDDGPSNPVSVPDFTEINETNFHDIITSIDDYMDSFLGNTTADDINSLSNRLNELKNQDWVEDADIDDNTLWIKVTHGGYILYGKRSEIIDSTDSRSSVNGFIQRTNAIREKVDSNIKKITQSINEYIQDKSSSSTCSDAQISFSENIGLNPERKINPRATEANSNIIYGCKNKKILIADITAYDGRVSKMAEDLNAIELLFNNWYGLYEVDHKRGNEITVDFLKNHLTDYGLIFFVTHGGLVEQKNDTKPSFSFACLEEYISKSRSEEYLQPWVNDEIGLYKPTGGSVNLLPEEEKENEYPYQVVLKPNFFSSINGRFAENSIMVTVICKALSAVSKDNMSEYLIEKGLGAFIGFDNTCTVKMGEDALNVILQMLPHVVEDYKSSLKDAFSKHNKSPYINPNLDNIGNRLCSMVLNTSKDNIGLQSSVSEDEVVNLGLPSHWASHNLGAKGPEGTGQYYNPFTDGDNWLTGVISGSEYDPVKKAMGNDWHIPYDIDYYSLLGTCYHDGNFRYKGQAGVRITGPSGESVFFPYSGFKENSNTTYFNNASIYICGNQLNITPYYYKQRAQFWTGIYTIGDVSIFDFESGKDEIIEKRVLNVLPISLDIGCDLTIKHSDKTIIINKSRFTFPYGFTVRGVQRNNGKEYESFWENYNYKPSVKKVKIITYQDVVKNLKEKYPSYQIKTK